MAENYQTMQRVSDAANGTEQRHARCEWDGDYLYAFNFLAKLKS